MSAEEFHELHEHVEHGAHNPEMAPVSLTMAILAVLVAVVSLLGHRTHTEEVVMQTKANDQWAYFQGKDTRLHTDQKLLGLAGFVSTSDPTKVAAWLASTKAEADKYGQQELDLLSSGLKRDVTRALDRAVSRQLRMEDGLFSENARYSMALSAVGSPWAATKAS